MTKVLIVGGTGAVGRALVAELSKRDPSLDLEIVIPSRSASVSPVFEDSRVRLLQGDIFAPGFLLEHCQGARTLFLCFGLREYKANVWLEKWPAILRLSLDAAIQSGAGFVFADNLYAYGPGKVVADGERTTAFDEKTSKPGIRVALHRTLREEMNKPGAKVAVVGASDFFGPHCGHSSVLGSLVIEKIAMGGLSTPLGDPDVVHDYVYVPDLALVMVEISLRDDAWNQFWIAPTAVKGRTTRMIAQDVARLSGHEKVRMCRIPGTAFFLLRLMGLGMSEMKPWFTQPYQVDDSKTREILGILPTDYEECLKAEIARTLDESESAA